MQIMRKDSDIKQKQTRNDDVMEKETRHNNRKESMRVRRW